MTPIEKLKARLTSVADAIRDRTGETGKLTIEQMKAEIEYMPAGDDGETYILVDENGNEIPAVLTAEEVDLTATANDIRLGSIAVTDDGVIEGTKEIPSYHTTEGMFVVTSGKDFSIPIKNGRHQYTKLQALLCAFNTSLTDSVAVDRVVINSKVYKVNSTDIVSEVIANDETKKIELNLINDSGKIYLIRYFTYKEEY